MASPGVTAAIAHYVRRERDRRCGRAAAGCVLITLLPGGCLSEQAALPGAAQLVHEQARTPTTIRMKPNAAASPWVPGVEGEDTHGHGLGARKGQRDRGRASWIDVMKENRAPASTPFQMSGRVISERFQAVSSTDSAASMERWTTNELYGAHLYGTRLTARRR